MTLLCSRRLPCGSLVESFLFMFGVYVMTLKWQCVVWKLSTFVRQVHVWECLWAVFTVCFWLTVPPLSNFLRLSFEMMIVLVCVLFPKHSYSERYFFWHVHTVKTHLRHLLLPPKIAGTCRMKNKDMKITQIQVHTVVLLHSTNQRQLCHIEKTQLYNVSVSKLGAIC